MDKMKTIKKNGIRILKIIGMVYLVYVILVLSMAGISYFRPLPQDGSDKVVGSESWMEQVEDDRYLSEISIPGTHDSGTAYVSIPYGAQCQSTDIYQQLIQGYRALDLRLVLKEDEDTGEKRLCIMHGISHARVEASWNSDYLYLEDVLNQIYTFLEEHPTETVLCMFDTEQDGDDKAEVAHLLYATMNQQQDKWYCRNSNPTLGEVRGQAVLATRFGDVANVGEEACGLKFIWDYQGQYLVTGDAQVRSQMNEDTGIWVQNHSHYRPAAKWEVFQETLAHCNGDKNNFSINYLSTASGKLIFPCPKENARELNARLMETELSRGNYGIVFLDFGTASLAEHIYETNY